MALAGQDAGGGPPQLSLLPGRFCKNGAVSAIVLSGSSLCQRLREQGAAGFRPRPASARQGRRDLNHGRKLNMLRCLKETLIDWQYRPEIGRHRNPFASRAILRFSYLQRLTAVEDGGASRRRGNRE
jgi:hypothetical protein